MTETQEPLAERIEGALALLDASNDEHWTKDGKPRLDVLARHVGQAVTGRDLVAAGFGDLRRPTGRAPEAAEADEGEERGQRSDPVPLRFKGMLVRHEANALTLIADYLRHIEEMAPNVVDASPSMWALFDTAGQLRAEVVASLKALWHRNSGDGSGAA